MASAPFVHENNMHAANLAGVHVFCGLKLRKKGFRFGARKCARFDSGAGAGEKGGCGADADEGFLGSDWTRGVRTDLVEGGNNFTQAPLLCGLGNIIGQPPR